VVAGAERALGNCGNVGVVAGVDRESTRGGELTGEVEVLPREVGRYQDGAVAVDDAGGADADPEDPSGCRPLQALGQLRDDGEVIFAAVLALAGGDEVWRGAVASV